jgi:hypothetical protein
MENWPAGEGVAGRVKRVQIDGLAGRGRGCFDGRGRTAAMQAQGMLFGKSDEIWE